jgi:ubiquinone/menaquinone biosynthesis C-methylase UbiE
MSRGVREVFDAAAGAYGLGNPLLVVERPETEALLPPLVGRRVLDLGAGPGHYASLAWQRGARLAVALDLSRAMLAWAPAPRLVADAVALPLAAGTFDLVVAALVLSHASRPDQVLREVARVLCGGGQAVLSDLHPVAARLGWRRTFADGRGGQVIAPACPLDSEVLRRMAADAGLTVEAWREPAIGPSLEPCFGRTRRRDFMRLRGTPLLVVARLHKGQR